MMKNNDIKRNGSGYYDPTAYEAIKNMEVEKKNKHHKYIWMKVSNDKYELPVAIADTAEELALACRVSANSIYANIWRFERGDFHRSIYCKVLNDGGDDNEDCG